MTAGRLPAPLHPGASRGASITLIVDGRPVPAFEGEPVAAALLAAGRPVISRSFRFHRPRGLMCSTGQCGWCECRIDGRPSVRSCQVAAVDGLRVDGEHAWPSVRRDVFAILDLGWRWVAPTFYHHRFLRPRRLRKRYLDVIRRFGGRGRILSALDSAGPPLTRRVDSLTTDVAVIGGGPAGIAAATAAALAGASVLLLEADEAVGGPWRWRPGPLPDGRSLDDAVQALAAAGVVVLASATAVSIDETGVHAITPTQLLDIRARSIVIGTGSYERLPTVPGNDRPGVMGARTVEWLIRRHGIVPGRRAVLVGSGPDLALAAIALRSAGADVREVADVSEVADVQSLVAIDGRVRVTGARFRGRGRVRRHPADLVVVGDRVPATGLAGSAGAAGLAGPASVAGAAPAILLAGAAAGRPITDPEALEVAADVGRRAAEGRLSANGPDEVAGPASHSAAPALRAAAMVCFCEDVRVADIDRERQAGYADPELMKRRTGALTGPCQGKYCEPALCAALGMGSDAAASMPTQRPPARPVRLGDLVGAERSDVGRPGS